MKDATCVDCLDYEKTDPNDEKQCIEPKCKFNEQLSKEAECLPCPLKMKASDDGK